MTWTSGVCDWIFHLFQKIWEKQVNREDLFSLFHLTLSSLIILKKQQNNTNNGFIYLFIWPRHAINRILVPQLGTEPRPWQWRCWVLTNWIARKFSMAFYNTKEECHNRQTNAMHKFYTNCKSLSFKLNIYSSIITNKALNIYSNENTKTMCFLFNWGRVLLGKQCLKTWAMQIFFFKCRRESK